MSDGEIFVGFPRQNLPAIIIGICGALTRFVYRGLLESYKYSMSLYIRFKRKNQTVFLHVEPSTTFQQVKVRLGENFDMSPDNIILWASDKVR